MAVPKRRGSRGPNKPRTPEKGVKAKPTKTQATPPPGAAPPNPARRERQVSLAVAECRLKNPGAREIAEDSLRVLLEHRDVLALRMADGSITSEEGAVANGVQRNVLKWLAAMGVDALRAVDDCAACNGSGRDGTKDCSTCSGTGVAE